MYRRFLHEIYIIYEKFEHRWIKCIELKGDIEK